jgi:mRNA interferase MazF
VIKTVERYAIYLADLDPTRGGEMAKMRPVVVVSPEAMNEHLDTIVVCPLTTQLHPRWRGRIQCRCAGRKAEIALDQIRAVSRRRLVKLLDRLDPSVAVRLRVLISEMYGAS